MRDRTVDGHEYIWNGAMLVWSAGLRAIPMSREPTDDEIRLLRIGYDAGHKDGIHSGKRILQNEFRNLMDCQPR